MASLHAPNLKAAAQVLCQPLGVGLRSMPNRMVFGEHLTNFGQQNQFSARHLGYYAERAQGGVGLLVSEALCVHPQDWPYEHALFGWDDAIIPNLARLQQCIHQANPNTLLLAQLGHTGCQQSGKMLRQSPWGPSVWQEPATRTMSRALLFHEIEAVVNSYANAARRVMAANWDGVEINAAQFSLLRQFLSPLTNQRQDAYGGDLKGRIRLLLAVLAAVKTTLDDQAVLGVKLCADELAPWGGLTPEDCQLVAKHLIALSPSQGRPHYLSLQIGGPYSTQMSDALMPTPQGFANHLAQGIRQAIADEAGGPVPVFADGRIEQPEVGAKAIVQHQADAVVMTRALISAPDLPRQLCASLRRQTTPTRISIRPHVGMGRYFAVRGDWNRPLSDLTNPRAGRETRAPFLQAASHGDSAPKARPMPLQPSARPATKPSSNDAPESTAKNSKTALVIGGGPAGMEAARVLASHQLAVTLWEGSHQLGGLASLLAQALPTRAEYSAWVKWCADELEHLQVAIHLNTPVTVTHSTALQQADVVVIAIGAQSDPTPMLTLPKTSHQAPLTPRQLLQPSHAKHLQVLKSKPVALLDAEMGWHTAAATECALLHGCEVHLVSEDFSVGRKVVENADFAWLERVAKAGVVFHTQLKAQRWQGGKLLCHNRFSGEESTIASTIPPVVCQAEIPPLQEVAQLLHMCPNALVVGDCRAPRLMGEAIFDAHRRVLHWLSS